MKKLRLVVLGFLCLTNSLPGEHIEPFANIDQLVQRSDSVMVVHILGRDETWFGNDGWSRYKASVLFVLKGAPQPRVPAVTLTLNNSTSDWSSGFISGRQYIAFLNKDSTTNTVYQGLPVVGSVMSASPTTRETGLKGTLRERIEQTIREGRDYSKMLHHKEQRVFSHLLGEPLPLLSVPLPATPAPKR